MAGRRPSSLNASGLVVVAVRPEATIGTAPLRPFAVHQIRLTYGVARSASDTPGATLGTDHHIGGTLPTTGDANRVLGALWRSEARIHHRALDHFFAEEFGGGRRTVELERAAPLRIEKGSPWVYGVLVNNVWSLSSDQRGGAYSSFLLQPFFNYNFPNGTYITSAPIVTANWKAESGQQWTVSLGIGVGHIFHVGKLPVNTQISGHYNVVHPDDGANWQLRAQLQLMFPK
jgi:hypothetical protein